MNTCCIRACLKPRSSIEWPVKGPAPPAAAHLLLMGDVAEGTQLPEEVLCFSEDSGICRFGKGGGGKRIWEEREECRSLLK